MATANGVKPEEDVQMKTELDDVPSIGYADDDEEDTGELNIPKSQNVVWLTRVPRYLWEYLSSVKEDEEVEIGTVKHWETPDGDQKIALSLKSGLPGQEEVPKEYRCNFVNVKSTNTYVFSEKDQGGFKPYIHRRPADRQANLGPKNEDNKVDKRRQGKRGIPKHTSLAGVVEHELSCVPVENDEYKRIEVLRAQKLLKPKTTYATDTLERGHEMTGATGFDGFIKTGQAARGARPQENKASRIAQNELLDLLYEKFKEYRYYRLSTLKKETNQPETYLKETLSKIAHLIKSGPHANTWELTPEAQESTYINRQDLKDEEAPDEGGDDGDDDDNLEMEDAL